MDDNKNNEKKKKKRFIIHNYLFQTNYIILYVE